MSHLATSPALDPTPAWEKFLEKNFKTLLLVFAAIVIAVGLYGIVQYMNRAAAVKAGEAYAAAKTVEDLDRVIQEHGGSMAAGNALLKKADLLWEQNKKTTSVDALQEFASKHKDHPLYPQALLALGSKLEALGKRGDAKPVFERVVNEFGKTDVAPLAEMRLGDLLWADGKEDEAKKVYEGLAAKFPGSDNAILNQGETRAQWIAAKLPTKEVDGPPKPKVDPAAAQKIPGMPNFNISGPKGLSATVGPDGANSPVINLTPGGTSTPITVTPGASMPAPAAPSVPASAVTLPVQAPATPAKPAAPAPVPAAPVKPAAPAPAASVPPAPAAPAAPAPTTPAAPAPATKAP